MDLTEFTRVAPRYVDGEANAEERRAIERCLLTDTGAQREIDFFDREARWIDRAFARTPQDITGVVIRVRRRNPYRRLHVSPLVALVAQVALLIGMAGLVLKLSTDLAPPRFHIIDAVGEVSADQHPITVATGDVPLGRPVVTSALSQARFQIGASDSVLLNQGGTIRLLPPRDEVRHVVEIEEGEIWARFIDRQANFQIRFWGMDDLNLHGAHAELNVVFGISFVNALVPRGYQAEPQARALALVRVVEGDAQLHRAKGDPLTFRAGQVWLISEDGNVRMLEDPDAAHYPVLRLDRYRRFKQRWEWLNVDRFPLSREVVPYELWKPLVDIADRIAERRQLTLHRDGASELIDFRKHVRANLAMAESRHGKPDTAELERIRATLGERDPKEIEVGVDRLHIDKDNARFLIALSGELNEILGAWENFEAYGDRDSIDRELLPLVLCRDISGALKVLANIESDAATRLERASGPSGAWEAVTRAGQFVDKAAQEYMAALGVLEANERSEFRDADGSKLAEIQKNTLRLKAEIDALQALAPELEFLRLALRPVDLRIEGLETELAPIRTQYDSAVAERSSLQQDLVSNTFDAAVLSAAEQGAAALAEHEKEIESARVALKSLIAAKGVELARRAAELETLGAGLVLARTQRQAIDDAVIAAAASISSFRTELASAQKLLDEENARYAALSTVEKTQPEARNRLERAQTRVALLEKELEASSSRLAVSMDQAIGKSDEIAGMEGRRGELEQLQIDARSKLAESETLLARHDTDLASTREKLKAAQAIRDEQALARTTRDDLVRRIGDLDKVIGPLGVRAGELESKVRAERDASASTRAKYVELFAKVGKISVLEEERRTQQGVADRYAGMEELIRKSRIDALVAQGELLADLAMHADRHMAYARLLGASLVRPASLEVETAERASHLEVALNSALSTESRDASVRAALTAGQKLEMDWRSFMTKAQQSNAERTNYAHARRLAFTYVRALESSVEARIIDANFRDVYDFKRYRDSLAGFDRPESASESSAVKTLLRAADPGLYALPDFGPQQVESVLRAEWELFYWADIVAERDRRAAIVRGEVVPEVENRDYYLPLLRLDPESRRVRNFAALWQNRLMDKRLLSDMQRAALRKTPVSATKDAS